MSKPFSADGLQSFLPSHREASLDWKGLRDAFHWIDRLHLCPHDFFHHAEGNVGIHVQMVVEEMLSSDDFWSLPERDRLVCFAAALMHDIAKPDVSKIVFPDGTETSPEGPNPPSGTRVTSRGHSRRGSVDARVMLWRSGWGYADREAVARMTLYHQYPFGAILRADPGSLARKLSQEVRLDLLCILAEADAKGRICADPAEREKSILHVELFRETAKETGCLTTPYAFPDDHTAWLYCRDVSFGLVPGRSPDHSAWFAPKCTVTLLSGLPGAGKDTWLSKNLPTIPVVGFDKARRDAGLTHDDNPGAAVQATIEEAKSFLRQGADFVWNATNISRQTGHQNREKVIGLLADYGARVEIVVLEEPESEIRRRNRSRPDAERVPDAAIDRMLHRWEPPLPTEAHAVRVFEKGISVFDHPRMEEEVPARSF